MGLRKASPDFSYCSPLTAHRSPSFTLIELLIVMLVIAILAGMLFPVVMKAKTWAREKQAMMEVKNIELAIKAYYSVYGKWPNQTQAATDTCYVLDNSVVIGALTTNNPRSKVFLQVQQSALSNGAYLDPWRHPYIIVMDDSCDNKIAVNKGGLVTADPPTNITVPLTNLNGVVTTNTLNFVADVAVGVASWGNRDTSLHIAQTSYVAQVTNISYLNMDLCSWLMGRKTK